MKNAYLITNRNITAAGPGPKLDDLHYSQADSLNFQVRRLASTHTHSRYS